MNLSRRSCALGSLLLLIACAGPQPEAPPAHAAAPTRAAEVAPVASARPPTAREIALACLLRAPRYTGAAVGEGADTPHEIHALTLLLAARELSPLQRLVREGSPAGRVFGLLGLQVLDEAAYQAALVGLREDQAPVTTFFGCILSESTVGAQSRELDEKRPASSAAGEWWLPRGPWWAAPDPRVEEEGFTAAEWVRRLAKDPHGARDALFTLRRHALPALIAGLSSEETGLRIECAELLGQLGSLALEAAPDLGARLQTDPEPLVRTRAARALWALGPWALTAEPALTAAVNDRAQPPETRIPAWRALTPRRGDAERGPGPAPLDLVETAALDPSQSVREWGREQLVAQWPASDAHAVALRVISAEPDSLLREGLVLDLLDARAADDAPATRQRARELQERLAQASVGEDDHEAWAGRVESLLADAADPAALLAALDAPHAALSAVDAALAAAPRPVLAELLQSARSPRLVALCARLLAQLHEQDAIDPLSRRLEREGDPRLRYLLAEALRQATGGR